MLMGLSSQANTGYIPNTLNYAAPKVDYHNRPTWPPKGLYLTN